MAGESSTPKWGASHADAMLRQGLAELRGALYPESNVAQPPQYGLFGNPTPGEVDRNAREASNDLSQWLAERGLDQPREAEPEKRESPGFEHE